MEDPRANHADSTNASGSTIPPADYLRIIINLGGVFELSINVAPDSHPAAREPVKKPALQSRLLEKSSFRLVSSCRLSFIMMMKG
jgi:hypothetical protein